MSLKTWIEEFYSVAAENLYKASDEECLKHSIKKWHGLKKENIEKHEITIDTSESNGFHSLEDKSSDTLSIDGGSCALCQKYDDHCYIENNEEVVYCPLYKHNGGTCQNSNPDNPWGKWMLTQDPKPMITALEETLKESNDNE